MLREVEAGDREFEETCLFRPGLDAMLPTAPARAEVYDAETDGANTYDAETDDAQAHDAEAHDAETYDERVTWLRRSCRRLTEEIGCALSTPITSVQRFYRERLGFGQAEATLAQLEHKHGVLQRKAGELRAATGNHVDLAP